MSEDYFAIYLQYIALISFGIYYFSLKDKDRFLVTILSFMFLILSYPYIENPKYLKRDLNSVIKSFKKSSSSSSSSSSKKYYSKASVEVDYGLEHPSAASITVHDEGGNNWIVEVKDWSGGQKIFVEPKYKQ